MEAIKAMCDRDVTYVDVKPDAQARYKEFSGKVSVITGPGSGIGRALTLELARRGARLALSDVDGDAVRRTAEACRGAGALEVESYQLDVSSREAVFAHADRSALASAG
jgi:NAD(P)-dependent dehydrogenase (short-subunit alcohol dehydrogenase family)